MGCIRRTKGKPPAKACCGGARACGFLLPTPPTRHDRGGRSAAVGLPSALATEGTAQPKICPAGASGRAAARQGMLRMGVVADKLIVGAWRGEWGPWIPLIDAGQDAQLPSSPGLYRLRVCGRDGLAYIGQTGRGDMHVRKRLRMLKGAYGALMPFRAPHTAGRAIWALIQGGAQLAASGMTVEGDERWRRSLEAVAIALYRQCYTGSPLVNFGRMPDGYAMSSGRNAQLRAAGKQRRGGSSTSILIEHTAGVPPAGLLDGDPVGREWCGHGWSAWLPIREAASTAGSNSVGLYRLRLPSERSLLYVGEGRIARRLRSHARAAVGVAVPSSPGFGEILASLTAGGWLSHQREELETDMIGAYVLRFGEAPFLQFRGRNRFADGSHL